MIRKPGGQQNLPLTLTPPVTLEMIREAWAAQGSQWDEIIRCEKPVFTARRVIWLPFGALAWDVFHAADAPYDTFGFIALNKDAWKTEHPRTIVLAN